MAKFSRRRGGQSKQRPIPLASAAVPVELEEGLQDRLIDAAKLTGWLHYHTRDSRRSPIGFPDLVMVRDGQMLIIECKRDLAEVAAMPRTERGRAQLAWIAAFSAVPGCRAAVVSPENEDVALAWITAARSECRMAPAPVDDGSDGVQ